MCDSGRRLLLVRSYSVSWGRMGLAFRPFKMKPLLPPGSVTNLILGLPLHDLANPGQQVLSSSMRMYQAHVSQLFLSPESGAV